MSSNALAPLYSSFASNRIFQPPNLPSREGTGEVSSFGADPALLKDLEKLSKQLTDKAPIPKGGSWGRYGVAPPDIRTQWARDEAAKQRSRVEQRKQRIAKQEFVNKVSC